MTRRFGVAMMALWLAAGIVMPAGAVEIHGHRGARGLAPENTIAAFRRGLAAGAETLELDVVLTADGVPVVSHDPALNPDLTRDANGRWLEGKGPLIRDLTLAALRGYDVGRARPGSALARDFPLQEPTDGERVPLLRDVLALGTPTTRFNIEIKFDPRSPERYASPDALVAALLQAIDAAGIADRAIVQSFDWGVLQRVQQTAPRLPTAYLTARRPNFDTVTNAVWTAGRRLSEHGDSLPRMVKAAGGRWWSPHFRDVDAAQLAEAHALGLKVAVWTVNDPSEMERLRSLGADALITDRPDLARAMPAR